MGNSSFSISSSVTGSPSLLGSASVSNEATLEIPDFTTDNFDLYFIKLLSVVPASDNVQLRLRTSSDGGTSFDSGATDYQYAEKRCVFSGASPSLTSNQSTGASYIPISAPAGNASAESLSGELLIYSPTQATTYTRLGYRAVCLDSSGNLSISVGGGLRGEVNIVDGIQIYFDTGNVASGEFRLYGARNS